jgi:hypothetical protein
MTFDVDVAGRVRRVRVEAAGGNRFTIAVDGQLHVVDAVRLDGTGMSLLFGDGGRSVEAQIVPGASSACSSAPATRSRLTSRCSSSRR